MIAKTLRTNLLTLATAYAKATGRSMSQVSKDFYGNVGFFAGFRTKKASITIDNYDVLIAKFRAEWPKGSPWPYLQAIVIPSPKRAR